MIAEFSCCLYACEDILHPPTIQLNAAWLLLSIFVSGSPFDAMKPYQRRFWFDQGGQLSAKFGIRHTPAVVTGAPISNGIKALKVSEVPLAPKGRAS